MSDAMPERVQCFVPTGGMIHLVPESDAGYVAWDDYAALRQRALEAEREMSNMAYEYNMLSSQSAREINALRTERDALQADLKALLARVLLNYHDNRAKGEYARLDGADESFFAAARAILDRETP